MNVDLLLSDEAERLYKENNGYLTLQECVNIVLLQKEKYLAANQNNQGTNLNEIIIANIIAHVLDIDNGQVYKPNTNEVIGDIEEVLK